MYYILVIILANVVITAANWILSPVRTAGALFEIAGMSLGATLAVFLLDALTAFLIRRLPGSWFAPGRPFFRVGAREKRFYRRIRIQRWVDRVPELGGFTGFHKDRLASATDREYLRRFLLESNYGVVIHLVNALCGILLPFLPWIGRRFWVAVPVGAVNAFLSLLPVFLLRNNTPVLLRLYLRACGKTEA